MKVCSAACSALVVLLLGCAACNDVKSSRASRDAGPEPADSAALYELGMAAPLDSAGPADMTGPTDAIVAVDIAAPSSDGPSTGLLVTGALLTLTGQGFGSKPNAAPIKYDDFEQGPDGQQISGWLLNGNTSVRPVYSTIRAFSGNKAALIDFPSGTYNNSMYLGGLGLDEVYLSYRVYVQDLGGSDPNPQLKFARATSGSSDFVHGDVDIGMTHLGAFGSGGPIWYNGGSGDGANFYGGSIPLNAWHRVEHYLKLSSPAGAANGKRYAKLNFSGYMTYSGLPGHFADPYQQGTPPTAYDGADIVTRRSEYAAQRIENVIMPFFTRSGQLLKVWVDEVYVDSTQSRLEIGNAARWEACTKRSPQQIVSWSNTSIAIVLNAADMAGDAYGFVVTAAGNIIELGQLGTWAN